MNIKDFIFTVTISIIIGFIIGYFSRELVSFIWRFYNKQIRPKKYLIKYHFDDIDLMQIPVKQEGELDK